ncbi:hypothetical protein BH10PLA1_BH10PLA1_18580 [soil metagenome]
MSKELERQIGIDRALEGAYGPESLTDGFIPFRSDEDKRARADGFRAGQIIAAQRKALADAKQPEESRHDDGDRASESLEAAREMAEAAAEAQREEQARLFEEAEEKAQERADEIVYKTNNPGDYECPYCMMISLKRGSRRCPKCQHDIESEHWDGVYAGEAALQRLQQEKAARDAAAHAAWLQSPEYLAEKAAKEAAASKAEQRRLEMASSERRARILSVVIPPVLIIVLLAYSTITKTYLGSLNGSVGIIAALLAYPTIATLVGIVIAQCYATIATRRTPHGFVRSCLILSIAGPATTGIVALLSISYEINFRPRQWEPRHESHLALYTFLFLAVVIVDYMGARYYRASRRSA